MRILRTTILAIGLMGLAACGGSSDSGSTTPAANPCGDSANPCGDTADNPCGDNPCGDTANPCGDNPCGDNPCGDNPCGDMDNPCGGDNPCGE